MAEYNLAVIPGDGVGVEVIAEGRKVLEALSEEGPGEGSGANFGSASFLGAPATTGKLAA